jgi:hypothetical protein
MGYFNRHGDRDSPTTKQEKKEESRQRYITP